MKGRVRARAFVHLLTGTVLLALVAACTPGPAGRSSPSPTATSSSPASTATSSSPGSTALPTTALPSAPTQAQKVQFIEAVFTDVQDTWSSAFHHGDIRYSPAALRIYSPANVPLSGHGCGLTNPNAGPHYCSADKTVYMDLQFLADLWNDTDGRLREASWAYVVAHEMGHHVQNLLGILTEVATEIKRDPSRKSDLSVREELQTDCLAGVWWHHAHERLDVTEADLQQIAETAVRLGDDYNGHSLEEYTHGTSAQRVHWLGVGFTDGTFKACDTFSGQI